MNSYRDVITAYFVDEYDFSPSAADQLIAALEQAGWCIVPLEPTEDMLNRGADPYLDGIHGATFQDDVGRVYRAMLASRPKPDTGDV